MIKKIALILFFIPVFTTVLFSQGRESDQRKERERKEQESKDFEEAPFIEKCFYGGNVSFNWSSSSYAGSRAMYFEFSPLIGYRMSTSFSTGVMATYKYFRGVNTYYNIIYDTHVYGGGIFGRLHLGDRFYLQGELEYLNTDAYNNLLQKFERKWISIASAGIGYGPKDESYSYAYFQITYDFIGDRDSPYPFSPIIPKNRIDNSVFRKRIVWALEKEKKGE